MYDFDIGSAVASISAKDLDLISKISDRAVNLLDVGLRLKPAQRLGIEMDLVAVHSKTPLRLFDLYKADDFNFVHDVVGIGNNLNRETGELENCFSPRFTS